MSQQQSEGLDLQELYKLMWSEKKIITAFAIVFVLIGGVYAFSSQQLWSSSAIIYKPKNSSFFDIKKQLSNLNITSNNHFNDYLNSTVVFEKFMREYNSYNNKRGFILSNETINKYKEVNNSDDDLFVSYWAKKIESNKDLESNGYELKFQSFNKYDSSKLLEQYIGYINKITLSDQYTEIDILISNEKNIINSHINLLLNSAKRKQQLEINKTKMELSIALASDVKKPIAMMNNRGLFSIDLGSKGLVEQEKILKNMKSLSIFEPKLIDENSKLLLLENIKLKYNFDITSYQFLKNVTPLDSRDKPRRGLLLIVSLMVGILFGMLYILLKDLYIRSMDEK
ncbi:TPA: Wzz/FepE/Etk N-terminal domain-containing protein [Photobacterium damselae]